MRKIWRCKEVDAAVVEALSLSLGIGSAIACLLAGRGISSREEGQLFLAPSFSAMPDPGLLAGMDSAVQRILKARTNGETVCVYGDYDVDGISSTALLISFFRRVGLACRYFIPNRFDDGYGLNRESLALIIASGATVIISVDCGITSSDEADFCQGQGVDLIITDHHSPKETIPHACAVINPHQPGCRYPFKLLAGVGVAFNMLIALRSALRQQGAFQKCTEPDLREWLDLVALGTIADVVPLVGQNRIYSSFGLKQLDASLRPGVTALKRVAGVKGAVSCGQVGFRLAPRLNAAGRMESAVPGVDLLLSSNVAECTVIADDLDAANAERQSVERAILDEAIAAVEAAGDYPARRSIVLASPAWHQGVVGIVASRIAERYYRPTILIALNEDGSGKGSGRSIPGFHLLDALSACSEHLDRFGGHRHAVGVALSASNLSEFSAAFEREAARVFADNELIPTLEIDAELNPADITVTLVNDLKRLEPFGAGNPEPNLLLRGVTVVDRRTVGEDHLKLRVTVAGYSFSAIAFRQADRPTDGLLDLVCIPELNSWNNSSTIQLRIKDMRSAEE
ncbi:MAG TPA: single-stranded-DNA-specific exonuclease RecJ [Desulfuromonadales bacterium]|nr:single-stranded-DNA-specific exonuclease RecJ [Desulfuromonadales bacterium]